MAQDNIDLRAAIERQRQALADSYLRFRQRRQGYNELLLTPALLEILGEIKDLRILDAGCGPGDIALYCAARGARVTAVDISDRMIREVCDRSTREGLAVDFQVGDIEDLGMLGDGSFDIIICLVAVAGRLNEIMREFSWLLPAGGRLYFGDVHPMFNKGRQEVRDGKPFLAVSDYFDRSVKSIVNPFGPVAGGEEISFFWKNYTLHDYFDALAGSAFLVQRFLEPAPRSCECRDGQKVAKADSYPFFFLIQAVRAHD
jgi:2-polyprenyl-3-methyl-5-hydroxy-6-metoxy-1,4-benzoquinol methylase